MERGYKFRIYPTAAQEELIRKSIGSARFVYNQTLALRQAAYQDHGVSLTGYDCIKLLPQLKEKYPWLREVDSTALQASVENMNTAYKNFFEGQSGKRKRKSGFPNFKAKHRSKMSFASKMNIRVEENAIRLPKLGLIEAKISQPVKGRILRATVSMSKSGKFFVSLNCTNVEIPQYPSSGAAVGIDLGVTDLLVTSDGQKYVNPKHLRKEEKKAICLQRRLSRKPKGSHNREKARIRLARQHEHIANMRQDALHKLTTQIVRDYDVICIEDLNIAGMLKNHRLAKFVQDASLGELTRQLKYKAEWQHKALVEVGRFYASSQLCDCCGFQNAEVKDLSVRAWTCPKCGSYHDRDINAASNILKEGLRILQAAS